MKLHVNRLSKILIIYSGLLTFGALVFIVINLLIFLGYDLRINLSLYKFNPGLDLILAFIGMLGLIVNLAGLVGAIYLRRLSPWARIVSLVYGASWFLTIPIGTAVSVYTIRTLTNPESKELFKKTIH